jgi:AraC-like DNA-binding protein
VNNEIVFEGPHGLNSFPFSVHYTNNKLYENIIYCHYHSDVEFIYVTQGVLNLQIDLNNFVIRSGEAAIVNSGEVHFGNSADDKDCSVYAIVFNPSMLSFNSFDICQTEYIGPFIDNKYKLPNHIKRDTFWGQAVLANMEDLIAATNKGGFGYELKVKALLYGILSEIIFNYPVIKNEDIITRRQDKIDKLKKALNYIQNNYMNRIYISDLAELLNMSEDNFFKFFKALTGKTPVSYINLYRIEAASDLLRDATLPLTEVCFSVGFENMSYFIKTFKKYKDCTPNDYRKTLHK